MDKTNFKDAYDIGENMAVLSGKGRSYTIINKETGKARLLVSEDGNFLSQTMRLILMRPIRGVLTSMVANGFDIGLADMIISEMAFAQSVGQYIPMDDTLLTKMVSAWKTMTKKRYIASSTRTWRL